MISFASLANADQAANQLEMNAVQKLTILGIENGSFTYVEGCWADDGSLKEAHDSVKFEGFTFSCYPSVIPGQLKPTDPKFYVWLPMRVGVFCNKYFKQKPLNRCISAYEQKAQWAGISVE